MHGEMHQLEGALAFLQIDIFSFRVAYCTQRLRATFGGIQFLLLDSSSLLVLQGGSQVRSR
jgi:hypothetical protein